jgi:tetratricopeptide (TPR) repeat protein
VRSRLICAIVLPVAAVLALIVSVSAGGCSVDPNENVPQTQVSSDIVQPVDDLTLAAGALESIPSSPDSKTAERALYYFNKWIHQQEEVSIEEKLDPLLDNLPPSYQIDRLKTDLRRRSITESDIFYLLQCSWLRDVAAQVAKQPIDADFQKWLPELEQSLGIDDAERLALAHRLFDWTIRNIQLDPLPPQPAPPRATTETNDPASVRASLPGPLRGELGPGYGHLPWQVLIYGHGDAWERSRIFILLARQAGLDAVMLGIPQTQGTGGTRPWIAAVLLRDQLYLFDAALGSPIAGPGGKGIATLEQVVADPGLLRALDLPGDTAYPIGADDLSEVSALIDGELPSLSVRMRLLEPAIVDKRKMKLMTSPSELKQRLLTCKHISAVSLWRVVVEAELYQVALSMALSSDPARLETHARETGLFLPSQPLMHARHLHLQGKFDAPPEGEEQAGARERYFKLRPSDKEIEALANMEGREALGVGEMVLPTDPAQKKAVLERMMGMTRSAKHHATFWIGLTHYESGDYAAAIEWFRDRVIAGAPDSPWQHGARYNLGRSYEALGQWEEARATYVTDESPQRHGNLLRAAAIAREHLQAAEASGATSAPADPRSAVNDP